MKKFEYTEALEISQRLMTELVRFPVKPGKAAVDMRTAIGKFLAKFPVMASDGVLGTELLNCFELAREAGATLNSMARVRATLFAEVPAYHMGVVIVNAAIQFSFIEESKIISVQEFASRGEVDELMDAMNVAIEEIKLNKADSFVSSDYQTFVFLSALLIQHMSSTQRQLPRVVQYTWPIHYPSLAMSNRIYGEGSRSEELIAENKVVHPLFMQRHIVALSA